MQYMESQTIRCISAHDPRPTLHYLPLTWHASFHLCLRKKDVLVDDGIIFHQLEFLWGVPCVFAGDVKEAGPSSAQQFDQYALGFSFSHPSAVPVTIIR